MSEPPLDPAPKTTLRNWGFCFILNRIDVECSTPLEIIPGHFLQKPNAQQLQQIKERVEPYNTFGVRPLTFLYELAGPTQTPLPPNQWLYWIIQFNGTNIEIGDLQIASLLLKDSLYVEMTFATHVIEDGREPTTGFLWSPGAVFQYYNWRIFHWESQTRVVTKAELDEIVASYLLLKKATGTSLHATASRFRNLSDLSDFSELKVIGYFSIIEALITHKPKFDLIDSLIHQVKTKMHLLATKFQRPLDYQAAFGIANSDAVWGKLYSYRSKLAHGDEPDFRGELQLLKSRDNAMAFLKEAAKLTVLCALREPEFIKDLKAC